MGSRSWGFKLPSGVSREEVRSALKERYLERAGKVPDRAAAAMLALTTGRRRGEIAMLTRGDVYWDKRTIRRHILKKGRNRVVEMPFGRNTMLVLKRLLKQYIAEHGREPKSERVVGGNPRSRSIGFKRWARRMGRNLRFHDLRHLYALKLLGEGAPLSIIRLALQHSDVKVTSLYLELHPEELRDRVVRFL